MTTTAVTKHRREQVSLCLSKSMVSPAQIAKHTGQHINSVNNDLRWMRKHSRKWLSGHTLDGYIFETKKTIEQLQDIELELQSLRSQEKDLDNKLKIIKQLADIINMRWVIQGDGPTLMNINTVKDYGR